MAGHDDELPPGSTQKMMKKLREGLELGGKFHFSVKAETDTSENPAPITGTSAGDTPLPVETMPITGTSSGLSSFSGEVHAEPSTAPKALRIYCSGTAYDENVSGEIIAEVYNDDTGEPGRDKLHLKGPGKAGHANTLRGMVGGKTDMKGNAEISANWLVDRICDEVKNGNTRFEIPIMGWSRGAITAIMISNRLEEVRERVMTRLSNEMRPEDHPGWQERLSIESKLLLMDPVRGPTNDRTTLLGSIRRGSVEGQTRMSTINPEHVTEVNILYARDEGRSIMRPVLPDILHGPGMPEPVVRIVSLPGVHSSLVTPDVTATSEEKEKTFLATAIITQNFCQRNHIPMRIAPLLEAATAKIGRALPPQTYLSTIAGIVAEENRQSSPKESKRLKSRNITVTELERTSNADYSMMLMENFMEKHCPNLYNVMTKADFEEMDSAYSELKFLTKEITKLAPEQREMIYRKFESSFLKSDMMDVIQAVHPEGASQDAAFPRQPPSLDLLTPPAPRRARASTRSAPSTAEDLSVLRRPRSFGLFRPSGTAGGPLPPSSSAPGQEQEKEPEKPKPT